jgi:ketosteroid isomerase-like protein
LKKILNIVGIVALLLLGVWIYRILFPNDEKLIRQLLAEAAETAAVKPDENPLLKIAGASKLVAFFSPDAVLKLDVAGVDTRTLDDPDDLRQAVTAARASLQEAKFQLHEVLVNVGPDSQSATAQLVALAYLNGSADPLVQELKIQLKKIDRRWKISRVETVKSLRM